MRRMTLVLSLTLIALLLGSQTALGLHGTPMLVEQSLPGNYTNDLRGADILTDDSAGNAYLIYPLVQLRIWLL